MLRVFSSFILALCITLVSAQETALNKLLQAEELEHASVGVSVKKLSDGSEKESHNANKLMVPASVLKIVTTSVAHAVLSPFFDYSTSFYISGGVSEGKLGGNIMVEGSGDPTFCATQEERDLLFEMVLMALQEQNVNVVRGNILVLPKVDFAATPASWTYEDVANYYGAAPQGINYLQNSYTIDLQQNEQRESLVQVVNVSDVDYTFDCKVVTGAPNSGDEAYIIGSPFSKERLIIGTIPPGTGTFRIKGSVGDPGSLFQRDLKGYLIANGIEINGSKVKDDSPALLFETHSDALQEIIRTTNAKSNNLYAEALLKSIGEGDKDRGLMQIDQWLQQANMPENEYHILDGSGMSVQNALTANFMTDYLRRINSTDADFKSTLPVSGVNGTMRYFTSARLKGRFAAKSGSMEGVLNYAGYLTTDAGEDLAVCIFINHYVGSRLELRRKIVTYMESLL